MYYDYAQSRYAKYKINADDEGRISIGQTLDTNISMIIHTLNT